ncbi:MAG TPA: thioredoxin [Candidatus Kapabacteria bacterium]|nr:thioredoxin [Candidatus Kapabacteria bacterium]
MAELKGVKNITDADFNEVTGTGLSLVDFWAPWCSPCRLQGPILEKVAGKVGEKAQIFKLNVDDSSQTANKFGITGIPTLLIFKDGQKVKQFVGLQDERVLVSTLESFM